MPDGPGAAIAPTAAVADACLRLGVPLRVAPQSLRPVLPGVAFTGAARPVTHLGSVDAVLDAIDAAPAGSVLVVDNGGRRDEACVGDLLVLEAAGAGLAGIVIWGLHRDTAQLREIGLPVVSLGAHPSGPRRTPAAGRSTFAAVLDGVVVSPHDRIVADDDGVLVVPEERWGELEAAARDIHSTESAQAAAMRAGTTLRDQLRYAEYRAAQRTDSELTLRRFLTETGGAIEV